MRLNELFNNPKMAKSKALVNVSAIFSSIVEGEVIQFPRPKDKRSDNQKYHDSISSQHGVTIDPTEKELIDVIERYYTGLTIDVDAVEAALYWFSADFNRGKDSNLYQVQHLSGYYPYSHADKVEDEDELTQEIYFTLYDYFSHLAEGEVIRPFPDKMLWSKKAHDNFTDKRSDDEKYDDAAKQQQLRNMSDEELYMLIQKGKKAKQQQLRAMSDDELASIIRAKDKQLWPDARIMELARGVMKDISVEFLKDKPDVYNNLSEWWGEFLIQLDPYNEYARSRLDQLLLQHPKWDSLNRALKNKHGYDLNDYNNNLKEVTEGDVIQFPGSKDKKTDDEKYDDEAAKQHNYDYRDDDISADDFLYWTPYSSDPQPDEENQEEEWKFDKEYYDGYYKEMGLDNQTRYKQIKQGNPSEKVIWYVLNKIAKSIGSSGPNNRIYPKEDLYAAMYWFSIWFGKKYGGINAEKITKKYKKYANVKNVHGTTENDDTDLYFDLRSYFALTDDERSEGINEKKKKRKKKKLDGAWNKAEQYTKYDPPGTNYGKNISARRGFVG